MLFAVEICGREFKTITLNSATQASRTKFKDKPEFSKPLTNRPGGADWSASVATKVRQDKDRYWNIPL